MVLVYSSNCQPMIISAHVTLTGIPNLGYSEEENFIQCKQLNYDTA